MKKIISIDDYHTIVENSAAAITMADEKERIVYLNKFANQLYGNIVGKKVSSLYPPEEWKRLRKENVRKKGLKHHFETKHIGKKGIIDVDISLSVLKKNSTIIGTIGITRDITERVKMEKALEHEQILLQELMDNIPDSIYFKDIQSKFVRVNKAKATRLKLKPSQIVGKTDFDYYPKEFAQRSFDDEQRIIKSGKPIIGKIEKIQKPNGTYRWISATKVPIKDNAGKVIGLVGISRDVTTEMEAEEQLRAMKDELQEKFIERTHELERVSKADRKKEIEKEREQFRKIFERK